MLTITYALAAMSVEQKQERGIILRIQQYLHLNAVKPQGIDPACLKLQLDELTRLAEVRHRQKIAGCLMPAVLRATHDAGPLLADLECLSRSGGEMLRSVRKCLRRAIKHGALQVKQLCGEVERYLQNLLQRLTKEEDELLPLARRVISREGWFEIGAAFLAHDAGQDERSRLVQLPSS